MNSLKTLGRSVRNTAMSGGRSTSTSANNNNNEHEQQQQGNGGGASSSSTSVSGVSAVMRRRASSSSSSSHNNNNNSGGENISNGGSNNKSSNVPRKRGTMMGTGAFAELNERLAERGEKLHGVADASEKMATDANDMLAAARALRMRQQQNKSKGFFS